MLSRIDQLAVVTAFAFLGQGMGLIGAGSALAQDANADLAKKLSNPVSSLISVPFQFNYDRGFGPNRGVRKTLDIQPVIPFSLNADWNLISRTVVPVIWQQDIAGLSSRQSGLGDITQSFFVSLKPQCCPKDPARKILRSIHEGARDMARDIAATDAYVTSRRERKKVEMLFAQPRGSSSDQVAMLPEFEQAAFGSCRATDHAAHREPQRSCSGSSAARSFAPWRGGLPLGSSAVSAPKGWRKQPEN